MTFFLYTFSAAEGAVPSVVVGMTPTIAPYDIEIISSLDWGTRHGGIRSPQAKGM